MLDRDGPVLDQDETALPPDAYEIARAITTAVNKNDVELLRRTMFHQATWPDGRSRSVMKPGVSRTLLCGFGNHSFAEFCFDKCRPHMLREVLLAARPAWVDGFPAARDSEWLRVLGTRLIEGQWTSVSLWNHAVLIGKPQSREFIMLLLDICRDDRAIQKLASLSPAAAALITECEMALALRQQAQGAHPAGIDCAATLVARPRRQCL